MAGRLPLAPSWFLVACLLCSVPVWSQITDQSLSSEAHAKYDAGELAQAETLFTQLLADHPSSSLAPDAQHHLGWIAYKQKKNKVAETRWQAVVDKYPTSPEAPKALMSITAVHYKTEATRDSLVSEYERTAAAYPNSDESAESRYRIGRLWLRDPPDFTKALQAHKSLVESSGSAKWRAEALADIGFAYLQKYTREKEQNAGDLAAALESLAQVRTRFPTEGDSVSRAEIRLARFHLHNKRDVPKAREILSAVVSSYPTSAHIVEAKYHLATCGGLSGDWESCINQCRQILEQYPQSTWSEYILYYIASCEHVRGRRSEAIAAYKKVIELYPSGEWATAARKTLDKMGVVQEGGGE